MLPAFLRSSSFKKRRQPGQSQKSGDPPHQPEGEQHGAPARFTRSRWHVSWHVLWHVFAHDFLDDFRLNRFNSFHHVSSCFITCMSLLILLILLGMLMLRTSIWIAFPWCFANRELRSTTSIWTPGWKHLHMALARHGLTTYVVSKNLGNSSTTSNKKKEQSKDVESIRIASQVTASLRNNTVIRVFYGVLVMAMAFKSQSSGPQVAKRISTDKDRFSPAKPRVHLMPTTGIP